jgi:prepilin-type N-terminal cleavage/methylation domain-containing protein
MTQKNKKNIFAKIAGFTLVELIVVIAIIGILAGIVYANFGIARAVARDDARKVALKEVQLALDLYKAQHGSYPLMGCGNPVTPTSRGSGGIWSSTHTSPARTISNSTCNSNEYIVGLVSGGYISALPIETIPSTNWISGYSYSSDGTDYKLLIFAERNFITSYDQDFARCPRQFTNNCTGVNPTPDVYAVYSPGAASW